MMNKYSSQTKLLSGIKNPSRVHAKSKLISVSTTIISESLLQYRIPEEYG
jgi:hypothetical protein